MYMFVNMDLNSDKAIVVNFIYTSASNKPASVQIII